MEHLSINAGNNIYFAFSSKGHGDRKHASDMGFEHFSKVYISLYCFGNRGICNLSFYLYQYIVSNLHLCTLLKKMFSHLYNDQEKTVFLFPCHSDENGF